MENYFYFFYNYWLSGYWLAVAIIISFCLGFVCRDAMTRRRFRRHHRHHKYALKGGDFMYIVKDNQVDVPYVVSFVITDAEGSPVPQPEVDVVVASDNPSAVAVILGADPLSGTVSFGSPNPDGTPAIANINVTVSLKDGTVIGSFGAQFTVTAGDPAAIAGGTIVFSGLTETLKK